MKTRLFGHACVDSRVQRNKRETRDTKKPSTKLDDIRFEAELSSVKFQNPKKNVKVHPKPPEIIIGALFLALICADVAQLCVFPLDPLDL